MPFIIWKETMEGFCNSINCMVCLSFVEGSLIKDFITSIPETVIKIF